MAEFTITWKNKETGEIFHDKVNVSTNGNLWDGESAARRAWLNELKQNNDANQRYDLLCNTGKSLKLTKQLIGTANAIPICAALWKT